MERFEGRKEAEKAGQMRENCKKNLNKKNAKRNNFVAVTKFYVKGVIQILGIVVSCLELLVIFTIYTSLQSLVFSSLSSYTTKPSLRKHVKHIHLNVYEPSPCDRCGKIFSTREKLSSHRNGVCYAKLKYCNVCGKDFKVAKALKEHLSTHTGEMIYSCEFCSEKYAFHSQLYIHYRKFHPIDWNALKAEKEIQRLNRQ